MYIHVYIYIYIYIYNEELSVSPHLTHSNFVIGNFQTCLIQHQPTSRRVSGYRDT